MKIIKKILMFLLIVLFSVTLSYAAINSDFYKIDKDKKMISRIGPETDVEAFKQKISVDKVYKSKSDKTEITSGLVGTGMVVIDGQDVYELSVAGDFDGDGKATQLELSKIIRHIVGLKGANLEGLEYESADLTGDGLVDQRDITKYIRYIVFGELDLGKPDNKPDTTPPTVMLEATQVFSSLIEVTANATDSESGVNENAVYTFYIKEGNGDYKKVQSLSSENKCVFQGLKQNTEYTIKVEVTDNVGNMGIKEKTIKTEKIPDTTIEGAITFSPIIWENGMAKVTINTNTHYLIQYQVNGTEEEKWEMFEVTVQDGAKPISNLEHNSVVYARLTDGTNAGEYATLQIKDTIAPKVTLNTTVNSVSSVTATANARDDETGIASNATYVFYIKEGNGEYVQKQNTTSKTCEFTGLKQNTIYTIKVEVEDRAGNKGEETKAITTSGIPDANQEGVIRVSPITWENGKAQVELDTDKYVIEYQINGIDEGEWKTLEITTQGWKKITDLEDNDRLYVRLTDGTNVGQYKEIIIKDIQEPTVILNTTANSTSKVTATAEAIDNETGIAEDATYTFYIKEGNGEYVQKQNTISKTCEFTELKQNITYTIKVEVEDKAGNKGSTTKVITTEGIPDASITEGAIIFGNVQWDNSVASVQISTNTDYKIEYQINSTAGTWTTSLTNGASVTVNNLGHNSILYARLTDGTNAGQYTTLEIIDAEKPEEFEITVTDITSIGCKITGSTTDGQTGIKDYTYIAEPTEGEPIIVEHITETSYIFTTLEESKEYKVYMIAYDNAGNERKSNEVTVKIEIPTISESQAFSRKNGVIDIVWLDTDNNVIEEPISPANYLGELVAIKYDDQKNEVIVDQPINDNSWYNYVAQMGTNDGKTSNWANARSNDSNAYFVWIPRYAYKITYFDTETNANKYRMDSSSKDGIIGYSTIDGMIDISTGEEKLVSGSIPVNVTGIVGNENYLEYIPHPAFEFDGSNAGIWVGKFENSGSLNSITIKPNATLLSGGYLQEKIKAGQDVKNTYGLQSIKDSHMIKSIEWGAVAYIADSKYGRNGTSITACDYGRTGGTDYRINEDQSTTGNIYGIYDMSGGAQWECVAGITKNVNGGYLDLTGIDSKYYDIYTTYSESKKIKGDAIYETSILGNNSPKSWHENLATGNFGNFSLMFCRGGQTGASGPGIFAFNIFQNTGTNYNFRIALVP